MGSIFEDRLCFGEENHIRGTRLLHEQRSIELVSLKNTIETIITQKKTT